MNADKQEIIDKTSEQVKTLLCRNWPEIERILEKEQEIKIAFGATITDRNTDPGEQADKSNRVKLTISFSERYTDSTEVPLESGAQMRLDLLLSGEPEHKPQTFATDPEGTEIDVDSLAKPGAEDAGSTPVGEALDKAAATTETPKVLMDIETAGWTPGGLITGFKTAATKAGWSKAQISVITDQLKGQTEVEAMKQTLRPHVIGEAVEA